MPKKKDSQGGDRSWLALAVLCFLAPLGLKGCAAQAGIPFPAAVLLAIVAVWIVAKAFDRRR